MSALPATVVHNLGDRRVMVVTEDMSLPTPQNSSIERGSILVVDKNDVVISDVINMDGARHLANQVLLGTPRVVCSAKTQITLAAAVLALLDPTNAIEEQT